MNKNADKCFGNATNVSLIKNSTDINSKFYLSHAPHLRTFPPPSAKIFSFLHVLFLTQADFLKNL